MFNISNTIKNIYDNVTQYERFDICLFVCAVLFWMWGGTFYFSKYVIDLYFDIGKPGIYYIYPCFFTVFILLTIHKFLKRITLEIAIFYILYIGFVVGSYIYGNEWIFNNDFILVGTLVGVPFLYLGRYVRLDKTLFDSFFIVSIVALITFLIVYRIFYKGEHFMTGAYVVLPYFLLFCAYFRHTGTLFCFLLTLFSFFVLCGQGNRGSTLTAILFICYEVILSLYNKIRRYDVLGILKAIALGIVLVLFFIVLYAFFTTKVEDYGFSTRSLDFIESGTAFEDEARTELIDQSWYFIRKNPLGYGFAGEFPLLFYPHNFFLQIFLEYGIILGTIVLLLLVFLSVRVVLIVAKAHRTRYRFIPTYLRFFLPSSTKQGSELYQQSPIANPMLPDFVAILFFCQLKLCVTGSYIGESMFFFWLGVMLNIVSMEKHCQYGKI